MVQTWLDSLNRFLLSTMTLVILEEFFFGCTLLAPNILIGYQLLLLHLHYL